MKLLKDLNALKSTKLYEDMKAFKDSKFVKDLKEELVEGIKAAQKSVKEGLKEIKESLEQKCPICGEKVSILITHELSDGNVVCFNCTEKVPSYIEFYFSEYYTIEMVKQLLEYMEYSKTKLKPIFTETASYHKIHLDENHGLFYIDKYEYEKFLYSELKYVTGLNIEFDPVEVKESVFGDKVLGEVSVCLDSSFPKYRYEYIGEAQVDVKKNMTGRKEWYEDPKDMQEFIIRFEAARQRFSDYSSYNHSNESYSKQDEWYDYSQYNQDHQSYSQADMNEIEKAKLTFGFDDGETFTLDELKRRRNKLMKAFHPDKGSESDTDADNRYAQKINNAYEILKKSLG